MSILRPVAAAGAAAETVAPACLAHAWLAEIEPSAGWAAAKPMTAEAEAVMLAGAQRPAIQLLGAKNPCNASSIAQQAVNNDWP